MDCAHSWKTDCFSFDDSHFVTTSVILGSANGMSRDAFSFCRLQSCIDVGGQADAQGSDGVGTGECCGGSEILNECAHGQIASISHSRVASKIYMTGDASFSIESWKQGLRFGNDGAAQ